MGTLPVGKADEPEIPVRALATLLSVIGYVWCAMVGIYVGYTAAMTVAPRNLFATFSLLALLMGPGLAAITVSWYLKSKSKRKTEAP